MSKKNTLLYLDEEMVQKAKDVGLNLSRITEDAIKSQLYPILSSDEQVIYNFEEYIENLEKTGYCFRLPFRIKNVSLKNIKCFDSFEAEFGDFTLIRGQNGSGKSVVLQSIAHACGVKDKFKEALKEGEEEGQIKVITDSEGVYSINFGIDDKGRKPTKCLLLDDVFTRVESEKIEEFIEKKLKERDVQVIMTARRMDFPEKPFDKIIDLGKKHLLRRKKQLLEEIDDLDRKVFRTRGRMHKLEMKKEDLSVEPDEIRKEKENVYEKIEQIDADLNVAESNRLIERLKKRKEKLKQKQETLKEKLAKVKDASNQKKMNEKISEKRRDLSILKADIERKKKELDEINSKLDEMG